MRGKEEGEKEGRKEGRKKKQGDNRKGKTEAGVKGRNQALPRLN